MPARYRNILFALALLAALAFGFKGTGNDSDDLNLACKEVCLAKKYQDGRANMVGADKNKFFGCACKDAQGKETVVDERGEVPQGRER